MRMNLPTLAFIALTVVASRFAKAQELSPKPILIRGVTVIDSAGHAPQHDMSVLISNGLIAAIAPAPEIKASPDSQVLEARGKYLIPGLWNMHVHLGAYADGKRNLSAFLDQGVVGVRDMGSPLDDILRLRQETNDETILGPRMVVAGPIIQGPLPFQNPVFVSVKDAAEGRRTVQMLKNRGVDFIKVQDAIPHDIYVAVADQARLENIPFVGHIAPTVLPEEASDLGQRSVEHLGGLFWTVLVGASTQESELHAEEIQMYEDTLAAVERGERTPHPNMDAQFTHKLLETYDVGKATALVARFKKNDTWQCPTLVVLHQSVDGDNKYTGEDLVWADRVVAKDTELVAMMQKAGVGLLAGTDLPPNTKNGTIHDELAALVNAGLTPTQALETATRGPAEFLGKLATLGTVEKGKVADLVLLNDNPLDDIHNTTHISAVILRGRLISHEAGAKR